jgi:Tol biopolymer transport system component
MPAWSPNGNTVAYAAEVDGVLQIFQRDPQAPSASQVTDSAFDCKYPFWSPDGRRIYYVSLAQSQEAIWSVLAGGGKPQVVVRNANRGAISPDGKTLAFFRDEGQSNVVGALALYLATPPGEAPWSNDVVEAAAVKYPPFKDRRFVEGALAFSPDGRRLGISAVGDWLNPDSRWWQFWMAPLPSGEPVRRFEVLNSDVAPRVSSFAWLPDNRHIVLGLISLSSFTSHLWMGDVDGDRAWTLASTPVSEEYPSVTRVGDEVEIVYSKDDSDYDIVEVPLDGSPPRPILQTARKETDPAWSPDGLLAYVTDRSGQDEIWLRDRDGRLADRPIIAQRNFGEDDRTVLLDSPVFSPDGQRVAYLRTGKNPVRPLRIWYSAFAGGTASPLLPMNREAYHGAPSWSPDGQWIAFAEYSDGKWRLVKVRVGSEERIELRSDGVPTATPKWSPTNDWLTWETADGFLLLSPDGTKQQFLSDVQWHAHTWSHDGASILGIRETDEYRLSLVTMEAKAGGRIRVLTDLGPSPPANNPVRGLSLSADGRRLVTSLLRMRGDLWLLNGVRWQQQRRWFP